MKVPWKNSAYATVNIFSKLTISYTYSWTGFCATEIFFSLEIWLYEISVTPLNVSKENVK